MVERSDTTGFVSRDESSPGRGASETRCCLTSAVGWHTSGVRIFFIACPVVTLRSTTGYRLISLRLEEISDIVALNNLMRIEISIEIPFIVVDPGFFQEFDKLLTKGPVPVMFLLARNVLSDGCFDGCAHREGGVAFLPAE